MLTFSFSVVIWKTERKKYSNLSRSVREVLRVPFSITGKCLDQLRRCNLKDQCFEQLITTSNITVTVNDSVLNDSGLYLVEVVTVNENGDITTTISSSINITVTKGKAML